jgi:aspartyl-tRNA(Asn)/glutamyl-tRNA(Gln) amidotransferase subunit C
MASSYFAQNGPRTAVIDFRRGACWRRSFVVRVVGMTLSIADVEHVASLARLGLSMAEKERMREQLSGILDHIGELTQLDTEKIPPTAQVSETLNVWREDEVRPSMSVQDVLGNAPRIRDGYFEVHTPLASEIDDE